MFSLFKAKPIANPPRLPNLDDDLYPLTLASQTITTPQELLLHALDTTFVNIDDDFNEAETFSEILQNNKTYQDWINFTVYGRYIQRSFSAFYGQTEDNFNADMSDLLRHELQRHAQRLPIGQTLFFGGQIPSNVRQVKLLTSTLNPYRAINQALKQPIPRNISQPAVIINDIRVTNERTLAFAVKHNKRTSERRYHDVILLDFTYLTLRSEEKIGVPHKTSSEKARNILIRYYEIG